MLVKTSADAFYEFITTVTLDVGTSTKAMLLQKIQYCGMVLVNQEKHLSITTNSYNVASFTAPITK